MLVGMESGRDRWRIALVTESFYPAVDGSTTTVRNVADRLIARGHEVLIVAPAPGLSAYRACRVARIRPVATSVGGGRGTQIRQALQRFVPDLVHVTSPGAIGRRALKQARLLGLPTLVSQQAPVAGALADAWLATIADRADRIVVTAPWMTKALGALGAPAHLWLPGVDRDVFSPERRDRALHDHWARAGKPGGPLVVVGFVGGLHKRHDVRRLADLAGLPDARLVVVGDGPQRGHLSERLPGAKFTGPMGTADLAVAVASMDVVVHPGERLTCAHALREAAASGVPVVAMRSGGAPGVVRHLETGLLADPADRRDFRDAVGAVVADSRRALLGAHARETVTRTWDETVDELLDLHYPAVDSPDLQPAA